ncbi:MAG: O-antigen ligase family protein [Gammaproteobacteria bacterium]|nr:O-antigen ligase family protein [Gammaproteobacteria bacterium]
MTRTESLSANKYQAIGFLDWLFFIWLLSLPFRTFSLVGDLSLDNMLTPFLIIVWLTRHLFLQEPFRAYLIRFSIPIFLMLAYLSLMHLRPMGSEETAAARLIDEIKILTYFLIPIFYVTDHVRLQIANGTIVFQALIGGASALAASLGFIEFANVRFEESRLGIDELPKAIGLYGSYGDLALLYGYALVVILFGQVPRLLPAGKAFLTRGILSISLIIGWLGSQSRNVLLTSLIAIACYLILRSLYRQDSHKRALSGIILLSVALFGVGGIYYFSEAIYELIATLGGSGAARTVQSRVDSYTVAQALIKDSPIFGVGVAEYQRYGEILDGLHNMWLSIWALGGVGAPICLLFLLLLGAKVAHRFAILEKSKEAIMIVVLIICILQATQFYVAKNSQALWVMMGVSMVYFVYGRRMLPRPTR